MVAASQSSGIVIVLDIRRPLINLVPGSSLGNLVRAGQCQGCGKDLIPVSQLLLVEGEL
jgi:hypothetical protein